MRFPMLSSGGQRRNSKRQAGCMASPPESGGGLFDKGDVLADLGNGGVLALVEAHLVLLEHVAALRVDGDDERAELLHLAAPQGFGHAQFVPVVLGDALHLGGRSGPAGYGAAGSAEHPALPSGFRAEPDSDEAL